MNYVSGKETCPLPYSPSKSYTVPRPIGWLSIVSKDGVVNFSHYSQWSNLAFDSRVVIFASNQSSDGRRKDKLNIAKIRPLAYLGFYEYTSITDVFEMKVLGASDSITAGLESETG